MGWAGKYEGKWFRFAFKNAAGKYVYVDDNGVVSETTTATYLDYSPFDWRDLEIKMQRDLARMTPFRTYTLPLSFVKDGAKILRDHVYRYGYEIGVTVLTQKRNHTTLLFEDYIQADVDFSRFVDEPDSFICKVNLLDSGLAAFLKSIENVTYEIPITGADVITVNYDGQELTNRVKWLVSDGVDVGNNPTEGHVWDAQISISESIADLDVQTQPWLKYDDLTADVITPGDKWFFKASTSGTATMTVAFTLDISDGTGGSQNFATRAVKVQLLKRSGGVNTTERVFVSEATFSVYFNTTYNVNDTFAFTYAEDDEFYLISSLDPLASPGTHLVNWNYGANSYAELTFISRLDAQPVQGFRIYHAARKLIETASNGQYTIASNILTNTALNYVVHLDSSAWNTVLFSGDCLRGVDNPKLKISLSRLRTFLRNVWGVTDSVEGDTLRFDLMGYYFRRNDVIATIDSVTKFKAYVADDLLCTNAKFGYDVGDYDLLNGKDAFNTSIEFKLPGVRPKGTLDFISDFKTDPLDAEFVRVSAFQEETTDNKNDNSIFAVEIDPTPSSGEYNIRRLSGTITGLTNADTAFNFGLTPKRCLIRNLPYIYSILPNTTSGTIKYQSSDRNNTLYTKLQGPTIDEDADIDVNTSQFKPSMPLFKPWYFEFECAPPEDLVSLVTANPYGVIKFLHNGNYYKGFIVDIGIKPAHRDTYTWKLLSTPDNDLTNLV